MVAGSIFAKASSTGAKTVNSSPFSVSTRFDVGVQLTGDRCGERGQDRVVRCGGGHRVLGHSGDRAGAIRNCLGVAGAAGADEVGRGVHLRFGRHRLFGRGGRGAWSLRSVRARSMGEQALSAMAAANAIGGRADTASCGTSCPPRFRGAGAVSQCQWCCGHPRRPTRGLRRPRGSDGSISESDSNSCRVNPNRRRAEEDVHLARGGASRSIAIRPSTLGSRAIAGTVLGHAGRCGDRWRGRARRRARTPSTMPGELLAARRRRRSAPPSPASTTCSRPRAFGLILRVLVDRSQSEEVLQEVFLEIWQSAARFAPNKGQGRSWVLTIAHRRAVDRVRSAQASTDRDVRAGFRDIGRRT